jgi:hypothetical protein
VTVQGNIRLLHGAEVQLHLPVCELIPLTFSCIPSAQSRSHPRSNFHQLSYWPTLQVDQNNRQFTWRRPTDISVCISCVTRLPTSINKKNKRMSQLHLQRLVQGHQWLIKKGYQPRTNTVKNEKGDSVTDSHSIMPTWRNRFSQLLNVHRVNDVRYTEIQTADPIVPEPRALNLR